jgi:hypothetical protein
MRALFSRALNAPLLTALSLCLTLPLLSWGFKARFNEAPANELERLRRWASAEMKRADLIGVRPLERELLKGDATLSMYWAVPCSSLCGAQPSCERECQPLTERADPLTQPPESRYLLELKAPRLNMSAQHSMPAFGAWRALHWSPKHRLLTLCHEHPSQGDVVLIYELRAPLTQPQDAPQQEEVTSFILRATHRLGVLRAFNERGEPQVFVEDSDEDGALEWRLFEEGLATLSPSPFQLTLPYQLHSEGLRLSSRLIRASAPTSDERRAWLLKRLQANQKAQKIDTAEETPRDTANARASRHETPHQRLMKDLLKLCLKGACREANQLAQLAYPQNDHMLALWAQLKSTLKVRP